MKADANNIEMSRYIDLERYHAVEQTHPFYVEMLEAINGFIREIHSGKSTVRTWEFGAGTGLATQELVNHEYLEVHALDIDQECFKLLSGFMGTRARCFCGDALTYVGETPYDLAVSVFAHDHIVFDRGPDLAANIRRNLKTGGHYLMGAEFLPKFDDDESQKEALHTYHGYIVSTALRDGHYELAKLEIDALRSGIEKIGDFKRYPEQFEEEMMSAAFTLRDKVKVGPEVPDDVGGIYVYLFEAV